MSKRNRSDETEAAVNPPTSASLQIYRQRCAVELQAAGI
ncbi:hypothetical protein OROMI_012903 [Orobanche minor]